MSCDVDDVVAVGVAAADAAVAGVGDVVAAAGCVCGWARQLFACRTACRWRPRRVKDLHRQSCNEKK